MKKIKLKSELSEKQIEADVSHFLGWVTPPGKRLPFRLIDVNEQATGADKKFELYIPIFLQFKVSQGLAAVHTEGLFRSSPSLRIQKFRSENGLNTDPTLYFKLRDISAKAIDYQHNVLFELSKTMAAFYVAPLVLELEEYCRKLFDPALRPMIDPFPIAPGQTILDRDFPTRIQQLPFLRAHISIAPHRRVESSDHYYSFSPNGTEIAWHSPEVLPHGVFRLSDVLSKVVRRAFQGRESWISKEQLYKNLVEIAPSFGIDLSIRTHWDNWLIIWLFSRQLYEQYEIKLILLATTEEMLKHWENETREFQ